MSKSIKKVIPYFFILLILAGIFGLAGKTDASQANQNEPCTYTVTVGGQFANNPPCVGVNGPQQTAAVPPPASTGNALYDSLSTCPPVSGCVGMVLYWLFYSIPSFLLSVAANFFNVIVSMTIQSDLYSNATFVGNAWEVVRDLSNIFFILILLYVAVQTILGLGHETKKVIVQVVIMALLINFSMFFSKIIIDTSNILALVFYNKINVTIVKDDKTLDTNYVPVLRGGTDKDVSGKMMGYFDPTKILTDKFFDKFRRTEYTFSATGALAATAGGALVGSWVPIVGTLVGGLVGIVGYSLSGFSNSVPIAISIGFILTAGSIIIFATYAFFMAGLAFLARMIELWILIIFSPFAFMSSTMPNILGNMKYIGWKSWIDRILKLSFMAPIFMFFMYLIFMIIQSNIFTSLVDRTDPEKQTWMETLLFMIIPAMVILILLMKATKYAKEASGEVGQMVINGTKFAAGLAVGGTALGGAQILRGSVGAFMKGASTGDTEARKLATGDPTLGKFGRTVGKLQQITGIDRLQQTVGRKLNADQHNVEHAAHARHELDNATGEVTHGRKKKFDELNGQERFEVKRKIARDRVVRENQGNTQGTAGLALGTRKWDALTNAERATIYGHINLNAHGDEDPAHGLILRSPSTDGLIQDARRKQGIISNAVQSSVTGSYDIRNIANVIAKEQSTGFAKMAMGLTGALAMGMRGGFKSMGVNYGESQKSFFKDLANTISESLKSVKINVDTSHVGEVKKEDGKGGGGHH
ncbi:hypothetical protein HYZ82_01240 [Candidatus Nomurabacteria bacterium]|nr:hypothetical protein [Candidatus Nomurabacteria bacterium]